MWTTAKSGAPREGASKKQADGSGMGRSQGKRWQRQVEDEERRRRGRRDPRQEGEEAKKEEKREAPDAKTDWWQEKRPMVSQCRSSLGRSIPQSRGRPKQATSRLVPGTGRQRTHREMAHAEPRWSDEEMRLAIALCAVGGGTGTFGDPSDQGTESPHPPAWPSQTTGVQRSGERRI